MTRPGQAALALVVVVGVPILAGQALKPEAGVPSPGATSLAVNLERSETDGNNAARLRIITEGPVPADPAVLTGEGGQDRVTVTPRSPAECSGLPVRRATSAEDATEWCLGLDGIDDGRTVSGVVAGSGTKLSLVVNRREPIWPLPLVVALAGLLVGALVLLIPQLLTAQVRRALLSRLLDDNDKAGPDARVDQLGEWVATRQEGGDKADGLVAVLSGVIERGPPAAHRARSDLAKAIEASTLVASHPFARAARAEAGKRGHSVQDFLKPDGSVRDVHPAREWLAALNQLEAQDAELTVIQQEITSSLTPGDCQVKPQEALSTARAVFSTVDSPDEVEEVEGKLEAVKQAIAREQARPECKARETFLVMGSGGGGLRMLAAATAETLDIGTSGVPARPPSSALLRATTGVLIFFVVAWALIAVMQGVYEPKPAFGTLTDYIALLTAATGSGAATAVFGLVAIWNPRTAADAR